MKPFTLRDFVRESNRIEGITRPPTAAEMRAHEAFLAERHPQIVTLARFVAGIDGGALRDCPGMNVYVGKHHPPPGGPAIPRALADILYRAVNHLDHPYHTHHQYETLHPFMDGNGRSGRVLWLWQMGGIQHAPLGFLHHMYYQMLEMGQRETT